MLFLGSIGQVSLGRRYAEWGLRVLVASLLAWSLIRALMAPAGSAVEVATSAELSAKLARWSTMASPARVHAVLDYPPPLEERDWLAALPGTGTAVSWSGTALVPTAAVLEPLADPAGGADLSVAAPAGAQVVLRDAFGPFDTVVAGGKAESPAESQAHTGVRVYLPSPPAVVEAAVGPVVAAAPLRDSLELGRLLVLGAAGWETKFTIAALEERGWKVDAMMAFSPKGQGDIRQGQIGSIDTAAYAAVLAIDTVAERYAEAIGRYVRSGGGLILWAGAAPAGALQALAPGVPAGALPDPDQVPTAAAPRRALRLRPLDHLKTEAMALETRGGRTALAAWRVGAGRVIQTGYLNTWRWRLAGRDGADRLALEAHRDWLARLVANVAYPRRQPRPAPAADAAPLATLVDRLGPATSPVPPVGDPARLSAWLFGVLLAATVLEWASRRLRGAK